jgi:hypothetical protein
MEFSTPIAANSAPALSRRSRMSQVDGRHAHQVFATLGPFFVKVMALRVTHTK